MGVIELLVLALGLSMDAFAVSICKGLSVPKLQAKHCLICGVYFGGFQALMPLIGWALGIRFQSMITNIDHWIAFALLAVIGANMIKESFSKEEECPDASFGFKTMLTLAVATSIDALSVGFTIAEYGWLMALAASGIIAVVTFFLCMAGLHIGKEFGTRLSGKASVLGGIILIGIGLEIFISGVFF